MPKPKTLKKDIAEKKAEREALDVKQVNISFNFPQSKYKRLIEQCSKKQVSITQITRDFLEKTANGEE